jgi:membrane dipeptidase
MIRPMPTATIPCWEAHTCLPMHPGADFGPLDQLRAAGVDFASVNVGMDMNPVSQVMSVIAGWRDRLANQPERYVLVEHFEDVERAAREGKLAVGFDLEGAMPLLEQPEMVHVYKRLGVHQMHLAYNRTNSIAGGCHDDDPGLTPLGRRVVEAINAAGMLMDCSHTGFRSSMDIMEASSAPVIFSHSNPKALVAHGRNITDEQIRACAATGGVVGISGISVFLGVEVPAARDIAAHARYVADLVGVEHVGIGMDHSAHQSELDDRPPGDFDPGYWWPANAGYRKGGISAITHAKPQTWCGMRQALIEAGFNGDEAAQVMGGNMARVAKNAWRRAGPGL